MAPTQDCLDEEFGLEADLTGADLTNANLSGAYLIAVTWTGATCPDSTVVDGATVTSCCGYLNGNTPAAGCP